MIKYLGSKRRLVPTISAMARAASARTAVDLFTGTTRVARGLKEAGLSVIAADSASYSEVLAEAYIATDSRRVDLGAVQHEIDQLNALEGHDGYVAQVFCQQARYFHPDNGRRIDAIREAIEQSHPAPIQSGARAAAVAPPSPPAPSPPAPVADPVRAILLTSLLEAADRVDSTTGLQMAFLKQWAPRATRPLSLRLPALLPGLGRAVLGDAVALAPRLPPVDFAYLDPPYNQHRYFTNYHVWETLVRWDAPEHYGIACKRVDARDGATASAFNRRKTMPSALKAVVESLKARLVVLSYNDESWVGLDELIAMCAQRGSVQVLRFDSKRYVGAQIGIHDPSGAKVGTVGRLRNEEWMVLSGEPDLVAAAARAGAEAPTALQPQ